MAATGRGALAPLDDLGVADRLFAEGYRFDFFQAVRVLEQLAGDRTTVDKGGPPDSEPVRFRAWLSLAFPSSPIFEVTPPSAKQPVPTMTVTFLGLTGPKSALPTHYTELLLRLEREGSFGEKQSLRDWLDIFNHRLVSLFYWAWKKYRFYVPYARGEYALKVPDPFTLCCFSLVGLGLPALRERLCVATTALPAEREPRVLAQINDLALLRYSGFLAHRPRCAVGLEALLRDYFALPVAIEQFRGQWLCIEPANQSHLALVGGNNQLGVNAVVGERVWDVASKVRVRLGPLSYEEFQEFLPDRAPVPRRKAFFLLVHLVRLYLGLELDFDVQLVLAADQVPECQLSDYAVGPRLGWNTWACSRSFTADAADACFEGQGLVAANDDSLHVGAGFL